MEYSNGEFIRFCKLKYGDRYDYSLTNYVGSHSKIKVICPRCGVFEVRAFSHKNRGDGCECHRHIKTKRQCINCNKEFYAVVRSKKLCHNCITKKRKLENIECFRKKKRDYYHTVLKKNPEIVIKERLKARLRNILKYNNINKTMNTLNLLGCDMSFFIKYLESKFKDGMSWDNRNLWHIDHIRPCASFDLTKPEDQRKCFHYTTLQPLWAEENLRKRDNIL